MDTIKMAPRILVAAPIYKNAKYCLKEFLDAMRGLSFENYEILLVDNSKEDDFFEELKKESDLLLLRDNSAETFNLKRLVHSRNRILDFAKDNRYDFVLMMDSDVIPPKEIIEKLIECEKDLVSGLYYGWFEVEGEVKQLPVAWMCLTEEEFEEMRRVYNVHESIKSRFDIRRHMTEEEALSGKVLEVLYASAGCMLISKNVLTSARYGLLDIPEGRTTSDDIYFFDDARKKGFIPFVHTGVKCDHLIKGKHIVDSDGNLSHPMYRSD